jgi:hypothetical protein
MKYQSWQTDPKRFRAMTGDDPCEFNDLLPCFETAHSRHLRYRTVGGKPRGGQRFAVINSGRSLCPASRNVWLSFCRTGN